MTGVQTCALPICKLGFDVNLQAVRSSGMSLSSRLLKLASFVGGAR